jgi:hypothetical protein
MTSGVYCLVLRLTIPSGHTSATSEALAMRGFDNQMPQTAAA